ncbi:MAG: ribosome biogenesis GTPase Der [Candidatus Methylomirabilales bacterium]
MGRLATVAIVGRPNVGKSTFFNRLVGGRRAIVEATPGVTRDRNYGTVRWRGRSFFLVDTGGFEPKAPAPISRRVVEQAHLAMEGADLILFLLDAGEGLTPLDEEIAQLLRQKAHKPVIPVANKVDTAMRGSHAAEFYRLGFAEVLSVSAEHGIGVGELLDHVLGLLPPGKEGEATGGAVTVAVVGRPNVGKSSLVNRILGEPRVIVSPDPGTTRDAVDTPFTYQGQRYLLVDTAGIRSKARTDYPLEYFSTLRAIKSVGRCDVALILLDPTTGVVRQDARIAGIVQEAGCASILLVNKWDLVERSPRAADEHLRHLREKLGHLDYAPVLFVSALTGQRIYKIFSLVERVLKERDRRIPPEKLNRFINEVVAAHPPPTRRKRPIKIWHTIQIGCRPPTFGLFVNDPHSISPSYARYLMNQLRATYGFEGNPIRLRFRGGRSPGGEGRHAPRD